MRVETPCPGPNASIREFAIWWMRNKPFLVPEDPTDAVRSYSGVNGITLFRQEPFQVQLFIVKPNRSSGRHAHPNIDSIEYGLAGADTFESDRNFRLHGLICVAPNEMHTAHADEKGGAFISIQKWLNGVKPSSVELDWTGGPMDQEHASFLGAPI